jgi:hypothetical protein
MVAHLAELACKPEAVQVDTVLVARENPVVLATAEAKAPCDRHHGSARWVRLEGMAAVQDHVMLTMHLLKPFVLPVDLL